MSATQNNAEFAPVRATKRPTQVYESAIEIPITKVRFSGSHSGIYRQDREFTEMTEIPNFRRTFSIGIRENMKISGNCFKKHVLVPAGVVPVALSDWYFGYSFNKEERHVLMTLTHKSEMLDDCKYGANCKSSYCTFGGDCVNKNEGIKAKVESTRKLINEGFFFKMEIRVTDERIDIQKLRDSLHEMFFDSTTPEVPKVLTKTSSSKPVTKTVSYSKVVGQAETVAPAAELAAQASTGKITKAHLMELQSDAEKYRKMKEYFENMHQKFDEQDPEELMFEFAKFCAKTINGVDVLEVEEEKAARKLSELETQMAELKAQMEAVEKAKETISKQKVSKLGKIPSVRVKDTSTNSETGSVTSNVIDTIVNQGGIPLLGEDQEQDQEPVEEFPTLKDSVKVLSKKTGNNWE